MTFDELYASYADSVYSFLRFKIRDVHLVEDIFQDTFLTAFKEVDRGVQPEHPKAWLLTIAHRRMVDRLRREPDVGAMSEQEEAIGTDRQADWAEALYVRELLGKLEESSRTILYGLYVEGLSIQEIAGMLGIPEGTVKSRCHAAKKKLSGWMKEENRDGN
ncbi:RNA polymerase sigma factor [Paenibacillus doosanensis]|uniref:RNA polymerase sigma factor n=1 Tax=Paenibacillus doosanensis TaxID=1229154 RepID=UPI00217F84CD|nr:RNA polymerase sigma factor [Paenibacillus doosanensis]MCS7458918.1 RNA polymerase sigma factor [Paenibacillus doosanensis]